MFPDQLSSNILFGFYISICVVSVLCIGEIDSHEKKIHVYEKFFAGQQGENLKNTTEILRTKRTAPKVTRPEEIKLQLISVCEDKTLNIQCEVGKVITIENANYGRMSLEKCNQSYNSQWNVNCRNNKTREIVKKKCNGKRSCDVAATNSVFGDPCYGTIKYLEIEYMCVSGELSTGINHQTTAHKVTDKNNPFSLYLCEDHMLQIECDKREKINILQANYGRTSLAKCDQKHKKPWSVTCVNNKTKNIVREMCNGKRSCDVEATNSVFGDPCFGTIKYLEMKYLCVPVDTNTGITPERIYKNETISKHVCENNKLRAECKRGYVIQLLKANYGRTTLAKCDEKIYEDWSVTCMNSKTEEIVRNRCNEKRKCNVEATNSIFGDPCFGTVKYLEIKYLCVPETTSISNSEMDTTESITNKNQPLSTYACEDNMLHMKCDESRRIHLLQANYGRTSLAKCDEKYKKPWSVNCVNDRSKEIVKGICNGKRNCDVEATNSVFGDPCYSTIKYLEMKYSCVPEDDDTDLVNTGIITPRRAPYKSEQLSMYVCENDKLHAECEEGFVIDVLQANYGRTTLEKCDEKIYEDWSVTCVNNKTEEIVRNICNEKRKCNVEVTNSIFGDPCVGTVKYLETKYLCVPDTTSISNYEMAPTESITNKNQPLSTYACEANMLHMKCDESRRIHLLQANYGRTSLAKCDEKYKKPWSVNCVNDRSKEIVKGICNGKRNCDVEATNSVFGDPCYGTIKYLEMQFLCVPEDDATDLVNTGVITPRKKPYKSEELSMYVCENDKLHAECEEGFVIDVLQANYGRTTLEKCDEKIYEDWSVTCVNNKTEEIVRKGCDGKHSCDIRASHNIFGDPCFGTLKYLEVQYLCVTGDGPISIHVCEHNTLHAECEKGYEIHVLQANYGRTSLSKCDRYITPEWNVNCVSNKSVEIVRNICDGKRNCDVRASNSVFGDTCSGIIKYLEVEYLCVPGEVDRGILHAEMTTTTHNAGEPISLYVCEHNKLHAECKKGNTIFILQANYGRTSLSKCDKSVNPHWNVKCVNNKTKEIVRKKCNKKRSCDVSATNSVFGDPCVGTIKYLEIRYLCVPDEVTTTISSIERNTPERTTYKTVSDAPKTVPYIPRTASVNPRIIADIPVTVSTTITKTESTFPTTDSITTRTLSNSPSTVPRTSFEFPRTESVIPRTESTIPRSTPDNPTTISNLSRIVSEILTTLSDISTETVNHVTTTFPEETNAPALDSSTITSTAKCSEYDLNCLKFVCPRKSGTFLHMTNRKMFIICINWRPSLRTCNRGLVFSEKFMTCVSEKRWWRKWGGVEGLENQPH